jgi:hypothetical protein
VIENARRLAARPFGELLPSSPPSYLRQQAAGLDPKLIPEKDTPVFGPPGEDEQLDP